MQRNDNEQPIFIVGTQRCGTTLLASMLGSHPNIVITPETTLLFNIDKIEQILKISQNVDIIICLLTEHPRWKDFGICSHKLCQKLKKHKTLTTFVVMHEFYRCFVERSGKIRWGDNTPTYCELLPVIVKFWPNAHIIHVYRDGRAVAASWLKLSWGPKTIEEAALLWKRRIIKCRDDSLVARHFLEVKYEDLIINAKNELEKICKFIKEPFDDKMLLYYTLDGIERYESMLRNKIWKERRYYHRNITRALDKKNINKWMKELSLKQIEIFQELAGEILTELSYPLL